MDREQRADIVEARDILRRGSGRARTAASHLDRVLAESCPHGPEAWMPFPDSEEAILCPACRVDWLPFPARVNAVDASEDASWHILKGGKSSNEIS